MWLPRLALLPATALIWLLPTMARSQIAGDPAFTQQSLMEAGGLLLLSIAAHLSRMSMHKLEAETGDTDPETGVLRERLLKDAVEREIARSRRFGREFALMMVGVDPRRLRFDYRDDEQWLPAFQATAALLSNTRTNIDHVFRYGDRFFALLLPETGAEEVTGLIRRLNRLAKSSDPAEGEPGGPLPIHVGVTFFPQCATRYEDLLRRAEVAMRLAEKSPTRVQLDGAEAPEMPAPQTLRRVEPDEALSGRWLGAEAPAEEEPAAWPAVAPTRAEAPVWRAQSAVLNSGSLSAAADDPPLEAAVSGLLRHLDETLALIRSLKGEAVEG